MRGSVSTVLIINGLGVMCSQAVICWNSVGFSSGVRRRCTCDVSTVDTMTRHGWPLSHPRLLDHQSAPVSRPSECLRSHDTQISQEDHSWD